MQIDIRPATVKDVDSLLQLYFSVYGDTYPLAIGTNRKVMTKVLKKPDSLWLVAVSGEKIVGCISFEVDAIHRIARAQGMAVSPDVRKGGIASRMLEEGTKELLEVRKSVNSVYATTRTVSKGPQIVFLRAGFLPLGIFPNAHKLKNFETVTLMAKFHPEALARRRPLPVVPAALSTIVGIVENVLGTKKEVQVGPVDKLKVQGEDLEFELILAPAYVKRTFNQRMQDPYDRFYPFHEPNLLLASTNDDLEIFAHFSPDGYCTIVSVSKPCWELHGRLGSLFNQLRVFGVTYLEILMCVEHSQSLSALLAAQFLPSAYYPGMYELNGEGHDMVLMSRTMQPLNFRGIEIERSFKPFVDQYVELWKKMHLEALEVFNDE